MRENAEEMRQALEQIRSKRCRHKPRCSVSIEMPSKLTKLRARRSQWLPAALPHSKASFGSEDLPVSERRAYLRAQRWWAACRTQLAERRRMREGDGERVDRTDMLPYLIP